MAQDLGNMAPFLVQSAEQKRGKVNRVNTYRKGPIFLVLKEPTLHGCSSHTVSMQKGFVFVVLLFVFPGFRPSWGLCKSQLQYSNAQ